MDNEPVRDEQIWEALSACRPDSDDLYDPEFAALARRLAIDPEFKERFEQMQRMDRVLKAAFQQAPVPERLGQRLLDRLAAARAQQTPEARVVPRRSARISRRGVLVAVATFSTSAVVLMAVVFGLRKPSSDTPSSVLEEAVQQFSVESPEASRLLSETQPEADYPLSHEVLQLPQIRWRSLKGFLGGSGVAYDLQRPGSGRATLYVVCRTVPGLPVVPPPVPASTTAGCSAAAWQEGDTLYVLVVEGDARDYQNYLSVSRGPVT